MLKDVLANKKEHRISIIAGGVALFAFIAIIPALAASVAITSLVADPELLQTEAEEALEAAPPATKEFLLDQLAGIIDNSGGAGIAAVIGVAGAVFSASGAMGNLMEGLNAAYGRQESRNFFVKRGTAVLLMLGALVVLATMVFTMSVVPALIENFIESSAVSAIVNVGRFVLLALIMTAGLSVLYRFGPAKQTESTTQLVPGGKQPLLTKGALIGLVLMLVLSIFFSFMTTNVSNYGETYGTLATIIIVLLWLNYMSLAILMGAEFDAYFARKKIYDARVEAGLPAVRPPAQAAA